MLGYKCKKKFFVFVLSGCHASTWRDLHRLNLFASGLNSIVCTTKKWRTENTKRNKKGPLFCVGTVLTPLFPGLFQVVTLPFFLSIAFLCFRLKLQPTLISSLKPTAGLCRWIAFARISCCLHQGIASTEELMPYLQEYCLGYLRVQSSSGMVALAHINHMPCSWTKSSLYFLCDYVFRECFQARAIVLNMYCELSCEGCFSHLSYLAFLFREYLRSLLSLI